VTQLSGSGRLSLLALPIFALILLGPRAGWVMVALSIALYTTVVFLGQAELLVLWNVADTDTSLFFWAFQGLRLSGVLFILMALLTRFHTLQRRTMIAELTALRKLETETADRLRLETEITRVSERERLKLGSELHDGLCQHLTAALLNCTALENKRNMEGSESGTEITGIRESIEESIDMAYDVARGLCPLDVTPDALVPALERLCRGVHERQGISCRMQTDGDVTVDNPEHALHLYRIVGEAVSNAVKHAQCSQITIRLTKKTTGVVLSVSDNGRGISEMIEDRKGLGRRIMAHRAELMGGALSVSTEPGRGTTVICRLPDAEGLL
jgi:signal transduction histidine kinase